MSDDLFLFYVGMLCGALIVLSIVTRPRKVPRPFLIGRDALVPRLGIPTAYRVRRKP